MLFFGNNEDVNVVANDVLVNCVGHDSCSRNDETFISEIDVLGRTFVLDIEQHDEVERCILESFIVVDIPKATKVLPIDDVPGKGVNFQNEVHN